MNKEISDAIDHIVQAFADAGRNAIVPFSVLCKAAGISEDDLPRLRTLIRYARPVALHRYQYAIVSDRGKGYRAAKSSDHQALASARRKIATRHLATGADILQHTDLSQLSDAERSAHETTRRAVVLLAAVAAEHDERIERLEQAVFGPNLPRPA